MRWEVAFLADGPFVGDFGNAEVTLSDKMVTNRGDGTCHTCAEPCEPGTRNRVLTERGDNGLETFRWCKPCCFAMVVYGHRPSVGDARQALAVTIAAIYTPPLRQVVRTLPRMGERDGARAVSDQVVS